MNQQVYVYKIIFGGDASIGKTALLKAFCDDFVTEKLTIGVGFFTKVMEIDDVEVRLQIWDLGGQDRFRFFTPIYLPGSSSVVLGFDVSRRRTFENLVDWLQLIRERLIGIPIHLVALKTDLPYDNISRDEIDAFVAEHGIINFTEVSVQENHNIGTAFRDLLDYLWNSTPVYINLKGD